MSAWSGRASERQSLPRTASPAFLANMLSRLAPENTPSAAPSTICSAKLFRFFRALRPRNAAPMRVAARSSSENCCRDCWPRKMD